jgi:hypothetical protein
VQKRLLTSPGSLRTVGFIIQPLQPVVDLASVLGIIACHRFNLIPTKPCKLDGLAQCLLTTNLDIPQDSGDLPYVGTVHKGGSASRETLTEGNAWMIEHAETFLDQSLSQVCTCLPCLPAARRQLIEGVQLDAQ